ncbi:MAG: glycosyl hydrolase 108 family protein [Caldimonas sp.]
MLGGVAEGFLKARQDARTQQEFEDAEKERQRAADAADKIAAATKAQPIGYVTGTADDTPSISAQDFRKKFGDANSTDADIPTFQSPSDAATWARNTSANWQPPTPPPAQALPAPQASVAAPPAAAPGAPPPAAAAPPPAGGLGATDARAVLSASPDTNFANLGARGPAPAAATPAPTPTSGTGKGLDAGYFFDNWIHPVEGGYNPHDSNGAPVKYGINGAAYPGVDIKNLTPEQAKSLYADRLTKSGADQLPAPLAAAYFDTYNLNEVAAKHMLQQSGGDVNKFLDLRENFLKGLEQNPKFEPYKASWDNRNAKLRSLVGNMQSSGAGDQANMPSQPSAVQHDTGLGAAPAAPAPPPRSYGPSDYTPFQAPDGTIRFTTSPKRVTQDDIDQRTAAIYYAHGMPEKGAAVLAGMQLRQSNAQAVAKGDIELQRTQAVAAVSKATSADQLEEPFNNAKNGQHAFTTTDPQTGAIHVEVRDNSTGRLVAAQDYDNFNAMKADVLQVVGSPDTYGQYLNQTKTANSSMISSIAQANQANTNAARNQAEINAGLPQAQVDTLKAQGRAADAEAGARRVDTQNAQVINGYMQRYLSVLNDPNASQQDKQQAQAGIATLKGQGQFDYAQVSVNGMPTTIKRYANGEEEIFDPTLGTYLPYGVPGFNMRQLDTDPDVQKGAISVAPGFKADGTKQWGFYVPGAGAQAYPTLAAAKEALKQKQARDKPPGLLDRLGAPQNAWAQPTEGSDNSALGVTGR